MWTSSAKLGGIDLEPGTVDATCHASIMTATPVYR